MNRRLRITTIERNNIRDAWLAFGDDACFVQCNDLKPPGNFERFTVFKQAARVRRPSRP